MLRIVIISEIVVAIALVTSILLQSRGAGLSSTFGGDFGGYYSKRGFEKFLVYISSFLAVAFIALAILNLVIASKIS